MKITCQSEVGALHSIALKHAKDALVSDAQIDKEWAALNFTDRPNREKAIEDYNAFEAIIRNTGADVFYLPEDPSVTMDSMYCRDAAIATDAGMILCNMGKVARKLEPLAQKMGYLKHGTPVLGEIVAPGTVEGGDVAWLDEKTLAVGHSYRTNEEGIAQLKNLLSPMGVEVVVVALPHYKGASDVFHLMSIFSPVDVDLAVVYSPLMPIAFRNELILRGYHFVEVPAEEFEMACNVLALAPRSCLMLDGFPKTKAALEAADCTVYTYEGTEISAKGGGGPTCLTRPIFRLT
jgi:N-dimethylarginine dimethylaminohydrolase